VENKKKRVLSAGCPVGLKYRLKLNGNQKHKSPNRHARRFGLFQVKITGRCTSVEIAKNRNYNGYCVGTLRFWVADLRPFFLFYGASYFSAGGSTVTREA
jgi:hypothetical protein